MLSIIRRRDGESVLSIWNSAHGSGFWRWLSGRLTAYWLGFGTGHRARSVNLEWAVRPSFQFCADLEFDDDRGIVLHAAVPMISLFLSFEGFVPHRWQWNAEKKTFGWWPRDREVGIALRDGCLRLKLWAPTMEWSQGQPWWWDINLPFADWIRGPRDYQIEDLSEPVEVEIPLPEGNYRALVKWQRQTWKWKRWGNLGKETRVSADVEIPKGLPFPGKGENSWDCGDDAIYGTGVSCREGDLASVIAKMVQIVLERRQRYGGSALWRARVEA